MARKYSRQLIIESAIIGALIMGTAAGGTAAILNIPPAWQSLLNPNTVQVHYDISALALFYNSTLAYLGSDNFGNVSSLLSTFAFVNIPQSLNQTALSANSQISTMNKTIAGAVSDFNSSAAFTSKNQFVNASLEIQGACSQINNAAAAFIQFESLTTPSFSRLGVPVEEYAVGANLTASEIARLDAECITLSSNNPPINSTSSNTVTYTFNGTTYTAILTISSAQKAINTGGSVILLGNLNANSKGLASQTIFFYLNGTFIGSGVSNSKGLVYANLTIPFVYVPEAVISAYAKDNATIGFPGLVSNLLYFQITYNQTQIVLKKP